MQGEYDLAGFAVGVVDNQDHRWQNRCAWRCDRTRLDWSSGNGYSLARRVLLDQAKLSVTGRLPESISLWGVLLTPTRIYTKQVLTLIQEYPIKGMPITGGGITENL